jgi:ribosome-associated protein
MQCKRKTQNVKPKRKTQNEKPKTALIQITTTLAIDDREVEERFVRASGPGGQNVNKVSTAVQLRFDVNASSLPDDIKTRLIALAGSRMTMDGVLVIDAREHRTQAQNREAARARLVEFLARATRKPKKRRATRPSKAAKENRLTSKKRRAEIKAARGRTRGDE